MTLATWTLVIRPRANGLVIAGWSRLSTCDWPGTTAASLLLQGACGGAPTVSTPRFLTPDDVTPLSTLLREEYGVRDHAVQAVRTEGATPEYAASYAAAMAA